MTVIYMQMSYVRFEIRDQLLRKCSGLVIIKETERVTRFETPKRTKAVEIYFPSQLTVNISQVFR